VADVAVMGARVRSWLTVAVRVPVCSPHGFFPPRNAEMDGMRLAGVRMSPEAHAAYELGWHAAEDPQERAFAAFVLRRAFKGCGRRIGRLDVALTTAALAARARADARLAARSVWFESNPVGPDYAPASPPYEPTSPDTPNDLAATADLAAAAGLAAL
jgi:hypothetical protein